MSNYEIVPENKQFMFKAACPYCGGNLTYTANGWEQDDDGLWMADTFDCECSNEPDMENEYEWNEWFNTHSDMPMVYQMPVDEKVKQIINSKYRFELK